MSIRKSVPIGLYVTAMLALESVGVKELTAKDVTRRGIIELLHHWKFHGIAEEISKVWR